MGTGTTRRHAEQGVAELSALESDLGAHVARHEADLALVHARHRPDAVNLVHYLALRRHDVHGLQRLLSELGLSSLGRSEPHVMASVLATRATLSGRPLPIPPGVIGFEQGRAALDANTDALLGERPRRRVPRIMVTLDEQAADDYPFVRRLVACGMDIARINGAHDGPAQWEQMAANVERASDERGVRCRIAMDLAGPKLRTGALEDGPRVLRLRPRRDVRGRALAAVSFELRGEPADGRPDERTPRALPAVPVDHAWLSRRHVGDDVTLTDARGAHRRARITECTPSAGRASAEIWDTTYLETGLRMWCGDDVTSVGELPSTAQYHVLAPGDRLAVVRRAGPSPAWEHGRSGVAETSCPIEEIFDAVRVGERALLDDGKLAGIIEAVEPDRFLVRILEAPAGGGRLRAEKGINLPDTDLRLPLVTDADLPLLELAARRADMVSVSFLRREEDVDAVRGQLDRLGAGELGIVLKIETQAAFKNLPAILLHAMRSPAVGVMIARGDLAVEVGYPRLAEVQEEILWLAEAAHLPVIWATEVLDRLARTGRPSRAEVTDAAMAQRAECVMLNKGPYVAEAITELDDILRRMARHQRKTVPLLGPLRTWSDF